MSEQPKIHTPERPTCDWPGCQWPKCRERWGDPQAKRTRAENERLRTPKPI